MSDYTKQKAQNLVDTQSIKKTDDVSTYQVKSSKPGKIHMIKNGICDCQGFRFREDCSHVLAVKKMQNIEKDAMISKIKSYSKDEKLKHAKLLLDILRQRGWNSQKEYEQWQSQITPRREELVLLKKMMIDRVIGCRN